MFLKNINNLLYLQDKRIIIQIDQMILNQSKVADNKDIF